MEDYIKMHLLSTTHPILTLMSLKGILEMLPDALFSRIHRSFIVSYAQLKCIHNKRVRLTTNKKLPVKAQVYLESQRGCVQSEGFRSYQTFNSGTYQQIGKEPFGAIQAFDDQTLLPLVSSFIEVDELTEIVLIPLVGAIEFTTGSKEANYINSGEAYHFFARPEGNYQITNPYPEDPVNYLQIRFKTTALRSDEAFLNQTLQNIFDIFEKNTLHPVFNTFNRKSSAVIGKYEGRQEGICKIQNSGNGIFAFVIEGAFEVQNRLLEKRDGLSLLNVEEVELEALSNDAVILVVEVGMIL